MLYLHPLNLKHLTANAKLCFIIFLSTFQIVVGHDYLKGLSTDLLKNRLKN